MENENEGETYQSQPARKSLSWMSQPWRRLTKKPSKDTGESSSSGPVQQPDNIEPTPPKRPKWASPCEETENWSENVIEFYRHGDAEFCFLSLFEAGVRIDKGFWATLLGHKNYGSLSPRVKLLYFGIF